MNKSVLASTVVLGFLLVILGFKYFSAPSLQLANIATQKSSVTAAKQTNTELNVYQQIDPTGKLPIKFDKISIHSGETALDLLNTTHQVKMKGEGVNAFITSIDEKTADNTKHEFWAFYVNGKQAQVGAGSYKLLPNDKVLWKIETY